MRLLLPVGCVRLRYDVTFVVPVVNDAAQLADENIHELNDLLLLCLFTVFPEVRQHTY